MSQTFSDTVMLDPPAGAKDGFSELLRQESLLKTGALQNAIFNSANFSSIATDARASSRFSMLAPNACWVMPPPT